MPGSPIYVGWGNWAKYDRCLQRYTQCEYLGSTFSFGTNHLVITIYLFWNS